MTEERRTQEPDDPVWDAIRDYRLLSSPMTQAARRLLGKTLERCRLSAGAFVLLRQPQMELRVVLGADLPGPTQGSLFHQAAQQPALWVLEDLMADERAKACVEVTGPPGLRFFASVPIKAPNDVVVGLLTVFDTRPQSVPTDTIASLLPGFASAFEQLFVRRAGQDLESDSGLLGRQVLCERFDEEWKQARSRARSLDLLVCSLPGLGRINRRLGVEAGDAAVATLVAGLQRKLLAERVLFGRMSGSTVGVLLPSRLSNEFVQATADAVRGGLHLPDGRSIELAVALFNLWPARHGQIDSQLVLRAMERITARRKLCRYPAVPHFSAEHIRELTPQGAVATSE